MKDVKNFYIYREVYENIKKGLNISKIASKLNTTRQRLTPYSKPLKTLRLIEKTDIYGEWKVVGEFDENLIKKHILNNRCKKKTTVIGKAQRQELKQNDARGHAFQLKLLLPKNYRNWKKREEIFNHMEMDWKPAKVGGVKRGQTVIINNEKVDLYRETIVITLAEDIVKKSVKEAKVYLISKCFKIIKKLERKFNNSPLCDYGKYKFRVTRQHYALIKNSLAKQYLNEKRKLEVYTGKGLWLLIDNSFNLSELETVHPETADEDGEKVQTVFNQIKVEELETLKEMSHSNIKEILIEQSKSNLITSKLVQENARSNKIYGDNSVRHVSLMASIEERIIKMDNRDERLIVSLERLSKN